MGYPDAGTSSQGKTSFGGWAGPTWASLSRICSPSQSVTLSMDALLIYIQNWSKVLNRPLTLPIFEAGMDHLINIQTQRHRPAGRFLSRLEQCETWGGQRDQGMTVSHFVLGSSKTTKKIHDSVCVRGMCWKRHPMQRCANTQGSVMFSVGLPLVPSLRNPGLV